MYATHCCVMRPLHQRMQRGLEDISAADMENESKYCRMIKLLTVNVAKPPAELNAALSDKDPLMTAAEELTCGDENSLNRFRAHVITGRKGVQRL